MGFTALEFYSGIGGMHYALQLAAPAAAVLDAFDINHSANRCYEHNFGKAPKQVNVVIGMRAEFEMPAMCMPQAWPWQLGVQALLP